MVRKSNIISGSAMALSAIVLWFQASGSERALVAEGIHPMDYPRALIGLLFALSVILIFLPSKKEPRDIPIISPRTAGTAATLVLYAASLQFTGFALSSFVCASLCAVIMGWKNYKILTLVNAAGCLCIWALFTYALKIPLPVGSIWRLWQ